MSLRSDDSGSEGENVAFEGEQTITAKTMATVREPGNEHAECFQPALAELGLPTVAGA